MKFKLGKKPAAPAPVPEKSEIKSREIIRMINKLDDVQKELGKVIVGQEDVIKQVLVCIMCDANALLESFPGMGKTLTIKTLSEILDLSFSRIQNTPDLMPSDITGTYIIEERAGKKDFKFQKGPIFANIILADEINRATPKTQAALLEAMQEKQVTVGKETFILDKPFFVLATQNPIDLEGTYPLPEAQLDRFLMKILLTYPNFKEEIKIVERYTKLIGTEKLRKAISHEDLLELQKLIRMVPVSNETTDYIVNLVTKTRNSDYIEYGASPRASIGLTLAAKAFALINKRNYVSKKDVQEMALPVLRHRIILNFKAEKEGLKPDDVIKKLL
jgi:MoxR-like ATPase